MCDGALPRRLQNVCIYFGSRLLLREAAAGRSAVVGWRADLLVALGAVRADHEDDDRQEEDGEQDRTADDQTQLN